MAKEIERKFLVRNDSYRQLASGLAFKQGYLSTDPDRVVRVRVEGDKGFITVKGRSTGPTRLEFEYEIPVEDAEEMLSLLCEKPLIEKSRYRCGYKGFSWEVDEFHGHNEGLVLAEIELEIEDQEFPRPEWVGREVTGDPRYFNSNLAKNPYREWKDE